MSARGDQFMSNFQASATSQSTSPTVRPGSVRKPVGITKGPGESTHEYTFVSRDDEQVLKNGEYVYYELTELVEAGEVGETGEAGEQGVNGAIPAMATRRVLGRIIKRVPL